MVKNGYGLDWIPSVAKIWDMQSLYAMCEI